MDVKDFVDHTLRGLVVIPQVIDTTVTTEGPVVDGYAFVSESLFLHFYFNAMRGTIAFALVREAERIWGVDYDNRRGWQMCVCAIASPGAAPR